MSEKLNGRYYDVEVKQEDAPYFFLLAKPEDGEVKGEVMHHGSYDQLVGLFCIHASAVLKVAKAEGKELDEACFELLQAIRMAKNLTQKRIMGEVLQ